MKYSLDFAHKSERCILSMPASKSAAIRMLLISALCKDETEIVLGDISKDIKSAVECIKELGCRAEETEGKILISPGIRKDIPHTFYVGESAALLRFLMPICASLGLKSDFILSGTLIDRPMDEMICILNTHGCRAEKNGSEISLEGHLEEGEYELDVTSSSQYLSGMLMVLPLMNNSTVKPLGNAVSTGYTDMTVEVMKTFSAFACYDNEKYFSKGKYVSPGSIICPSDASCAVPFLMLGALSKDGISAELPNSRIYQPDECFASILSQAGAEVTREGDIVTVRKKEIIPMKIDIDASPDIFPFLASLLSLAKGRSEIYVPERLRQKESDRIESVSSMLSSLGADVSYEKGVLTIFGKEKLMGGEVKTFHDHRIAMAASVLSYACDGEVIIDDGECIDKSFISFFSLLSDIGAEKKIISE